MWEWFNLIFSSVSSNFPSLPFHSLVFVHVWIFLRLSGLIFNIHYSSRLYHFLFFNLTTHIPLYYISIFLILLITIIMSVSCLSSHSFPHFPLLFLSLISVMLFYLPILSPFTRQCSAGTGCKSHGNTAGLPRDRAAVGITATICTRRTHSCQLWGRKTIILPTVHHAVLSSEAHLYFQSVLYRGEFLVLSLLSVFWGVTSSLITVKKPTILIWESWRYVFIKQALCIGCINYFLSGDKHSKIIHPTDEYFALISEKREMVILMMMMLYPLLHHSA